MDGQGCYLWRPQFRLLQQAQQMSFGEQETEFVFRLNGGKMQYRLSSQSGIIYRLHLRSEVKTLKSLLFLFRHLILVLYVTPDDLFIRTYRIHEVASLPEVVSPQFLFPQIRKLGK